MPEFFLELFSEEIPARLQRDAFKELRRICEAAFSELSLQRFGVQVGPRHISCAGDIAAEKPGFLLEARGPRDSAPEVALAGFLNKYQAKPHELVKEGGYFWLRRDEKPVAAAEIMKSVLAPALAKFSWPKSMRWGASGEFTWVRPLRRIVCLLDGEVIPITVGPITASSETEGHRVLGAGVFTVSSAENWREKLRANYVISDQDERRRMIADGIAEKAALLGLSVAEDDSLLEEVTGLVEWPVALIGKIDEKFMDLPPEVRELSMKVNQKYFALRDVDGKPAPHFAFVANLEAPDGGAAIIAGNERVLRARLSDARHFWDLDLKTPLDALLPKLAKITFHAKIGTQLERSERIAGLAKKIAKMLGANDATAEQAEWAGRLCKADLVTGMVGEFPELQGIMGGYYAEKNPHGWDGGIVGPAIKTHYQPKGPSDEVPIGTVAISVALADKLDTLVEFFGINEKPSGSGDPYALRRAALGVIRIVLENKLSDIDLGLICFSQSDVFTFILDRLKVKLRSEGQRFDVLDAATAFVADGNLVSLMEKVDAIAAMLNFGHGARLLNAYRRGVNILKHEESKDNRQYNGHFTRDLLVQSEEIALAEAIELQSGNALTDPTGRTWASFTSILQGLSRLDVPINAYLDKVIINDPASEIRHNRLQLLAEFRRVMHQIADFSKIEG